MAGNRNKDIRQVWFIVIVIMFVPLVISDAAAVGHDHPGTRHALRGDLRGEGGVSRRQRGHRRRGPRVTPERIALPCWTQDWSASPTTRRVRAIPTRSIITPAGG